MTDDLSSALSQLRQLSGARVRYLEDVWEIVEVLDDGPTLVLESLKRRVVQGSQYGEGHRRVPQRLSIPLLTNDGQHLNPELRGLKVEGARRR